MSVTGTADHSHVERQKRQALDPNRLETMSDDELEVELTIAAYTPGHLRWDRYQRLMLERLRRRLITA